MPTDPDFQNLMDRVRAGDQYAADELFHQYSHRLIALAKRRLGTGLGTKLEPEDILQSVFRSFFVRHADGRLDPHDRDHLWALLVTLTVRKCSAKIDHYRTEKRDVRREAGQPASAELSHVELEAIAREPTPREEATLADLVEALLAAFDVRDREIVSLILQGYSNPEIGTKVGCSERTVCRVAERARTRLSRLLERAEP